MPAAALHRGEPVGFTLGGETALTFVLMHGRGLDPAYMQALAERIGLAGIRYVLPVADANSWYPQSFLAPIAENEPRLSAALARYEEIVGGLLSVGIPARRLVVGGFSQGACLTAEYLARHPRRLAAAILWTGGLVGPDGTRWPLAPALAGLPVQITTSVTDPFVPPGRVEASAAWLKARGAAVEMTIFQAREHEVCEAEIEAARRLLGGLISAGQPSPG